MLHLTEINNLPNKPGVYKFFDQYQHLLYVGKATSLKTRVKSYFSIKHTKRRTLNMVSQIHFIDYIVTIDEAMARILENNLILLLKPQFNIQMREENNLPVIEITNHKFPQIKLSKISKAKDLVAGPFPTNNFALNIIKIVQKLYGIRTCDDSEFKNRSAPCMQYYFKQCSAPCINKISYEDYVFNLRQCELMLKGRYNKILIELHQRMQSNAKKLSFEQASIYRDLYHQINNFKKLQIIAVNSKIQSFDLIIPTINGGLLVIYTVIIRNGIRIADNYTILTLQNSSHSYKLIVNFLENRYSSYKNTETIYLDYKLNSQNKHHFMNIFNLKIIQINQNKVSTCIKDLLTHSRHNIDEIIRNYNYNNLYLGHTITHNY